MLKEEKGRKQFSSKWGIAGGEEGTYIRGSREKA